VVDGAAVADAAAVIEVACVLYWGHKGAIAEIELGLACEFHGGLAGGDVVIGEIGRGCMFTGGF
jgi:hypothetical protein